jgi:hypothetical protein
MSPVKPLETRVSSLHRLGITSLYIMWEWRCWQACKETRNPSVALKLHGIVMPASSVCPQWITRVGQAGTSVLCLYCPQVAGFSLFAWYDVFWHSINLITWLADWFVDCLMFFSAPSGIMIMSADNRTSRPICLGFKCRPGHRQSWLFFVVFLKPSRHAGVVP